MSVEDIPKIMEVAGQKGADGIRATVLADIFAKAKTAGGQGFTPNGLNRQMAKFGEDRLQALFGPKRFAKIKDLATVTGSLERGQKIAEGSQTAYLARIGALSGSAIASPLLAFKLAVGDVAFNRFISSKAGQRWLTTGLGMSPKVTRALTVAPQTLRVGQEESQ